MANEKMVNGTNWTYEVASNGTYTFNVKDKYVHKNMEIIVPKNQINKTYQDNTLILQSNSGGWTNANSISASMNTTTNYTLTIGD